ELHDAHRVRRLPVVGQDEFSDPEVAGAEDARHGEALHVRLCDAGRLNIAPAADALARLRILEHGVLPVNLVLHLEVVRVGRSPVEIQGRSNLAVFHRNRSSRHRRTPLGQVTLTEAGIPIYADIRRMISGELENLTRSASADKSEPQARGEEAGPMQPTTLVSQARCLGPTYRLGNLGNVAQVGATAPAKDVYPRHACRERPVLPGQLVGIAGVKLCRAVELGVAPARGVGAQASYPSRPVSVFEGRREVIGMGAVDHVI